LSVGFLKSSEDRPEYGTGLVSLLAVDFSQQFGEQRTGAGGLTRTMPFFLIYILRLGQL